MVFETYSTSSILAILPILLLLLLAAIVILADMIWKPSRRSLLGWVTAIGMGLILIVALLFSTPPENEPLIFGGTLRWDWLAFSFLVIFLFAGAVTALLSVGLTGLSDRGEYYALMIVSVQGMALMAAASDLIMVYLAIELTSIPLYVLAGFLKRDDKSTESGVKYFLFGAMTSAVMLYGFSLLYGYTGETNIYLIAESFNQGLIPGWVLGVTAALVLVGFGFKIAMVPFHFWTPDVYEGAPTPITAFVSTASKAAGFAVLLRVLMAVFPDIDLSLASVLAAVAVVTMTLGNLLALVQTNIKRLLAYSSIAHAGYALIGVVALSTFGAASMIFYLVAYVVTNLAAFGVVILFARSAGSDEIKDYAGLSRRSPKLALAMLVAMLSLAGMPPLAGFVAKVYVFLAAVRSDLIWLAFVGIFNAIIGLYYYLIVLKVIYLDRSEDEDKPIAVPVASALALGLCTMLILVIGIASAPWLDWAITAASSLF